MRFGMRVGNTYLSGGIIFWAFVGSALLAGFLLRASFWLTWITLRALAWGLCATARGIARWVRAGVREVNRDSVEINF
jgi:uncharacterized membrane protein